MARNKSSKDLRDIHVLEALIAAGDEPQMITLRLRPSILAQIEKAMTRRRIHHRTVLIERLVADTVSNQGDSQ